MSKVLRLHTGENTLAHWADTTGAYSTNVINQIVDPNGASSKKEITSIPSPFARIDLVKSAFRFVADTKKIEGDTIHHKMISDCFDVGEIFFNIDKLQDRIQILIWDKVNDLQELLNSSRPEHQVYGETLRIFLEQDASTYNFDKLKRIYLLNYIGPDKPNMMNIIGATSPATLFFTSANKLDFVSKNIQFGNDKPFDNTYSPLFKRDFEYQKYWYCLQHSIPSFSRLFPEVDDYLTLSYQHLNNMQKTEVTNLTTQNIDSDFEHLTVGSAANYVEIFDFILRKKQSDVAKIATSSDFLIKCMKDNSSHLPLVLPTEMYTRQAFYVQDSWNKDTKVPFFNKLPLNERVLPGDGSKYPYLTVGDFLEDTIIQTPYTFNKIRFFDGNINKEITNSSYLLPLKRRFFDYFSVQDLRSLMPDRKKMIEIEPLAGGSVKIILRIPIQRGNYITYERIYFTDSVPEIDENRGAVVSYNFGFGLFPALKYEVGQNAMYRLVLVDRDSIANDNNNYQLRFYEGNSEIDIQSMVKRNRNKDNKLIDDIRADSLSVALNSNFEYIEFSINDNTALIIPEFIQKNGTQKFRFAVDFGTTNTHIEYSVNGNPPLPFDMDEKDSQLQKLHLMYDDTDIDMIFDADFLPEEIGKNSKYRFPIRTILAESANTDWNCAVTSMANTNIPFVYEKQILPEYNKTNSELKWSNDSINQKRIEHYIEALFMILRNKVLLNNGNLEATEIVWFYPASMMKMRYNLFKQSWEKLYKQYFGLNIQNVKPISESIAPYYFHRSENGATSNVVCIDIGGGTTDILMVEDGNPKYLTSFRFAANSIFGDGYSIYSNQNGFVHKYKPLISQILIDNDLQSLQSVLQLLENKRVSADLIAFFFSLSINKDVRDKQIDIDFNKMLINDEEGKYVFILFYTAIIYHIANIMKLKEMKMPRYIAFSGTGSKVLNVISLDSSTLSDFTKIIFEKVYSQSYDTDGLKCIHTENPKEATCKGGVMERSGQSYSEVEQLKLVLLGTDSCKLVDQSMKYDQIGKEEIHAVVSECRKFVEFAFDLNKDFSFHKEFGANYSLFEIAKNECMKDLETFVKDGIKKKMTEISETGADPQIEESLFFYPLVGILNALARKLYEK